MGKHCHSNDRPATLVDHIVEHLRGDRLRAAWQRLDQSQKDTIAELRQFLTARSGAPLPETVARLREDVSDRSTRVQDCGLVRLVEGVDGALAALIANGTRRRRHCLRARERHLVVPAARGAAFRRGLRQLGCLVARGRACSPSAARATEAPEASAPAAEA